MIGIDPQLAGIRDDGSSEGITRTEIANAKHNLVAYPFKRGWFSQSGVAVSMGTTTAVSNPDGSCSCLAINVAYAPPSSSYLRFIVYGRVVGLRWWKGFYFPGTSEKAIDFGVMIDGVAYTVSNAMIARDSGLADAIYDPHGCAIIADDLDDGPHMVEVTFPCQSISTDGYAQWVFTGYLAERRVGYVESRRCTALGTPTAVPTSYGNVPGAGSTNAGAYRSVTYYNSTAGALTVTQKIVGVVWWSKSILANDTLKQEFGDLAVNLVDLTHIASGAGLTCTVELAY